MLNARVAELSVLQTPIERGQPVVVFLHGFATLPEDFAPFAAIAAKAGAAFVFPRSPRRVAAGVLDRPIPTATWWPVNPAARAAAMALGPRDLNEHYPHGVAAARKQLATLVHALRARYRPEFLAVGGFSQGAMLALEWQLHTRTRADALVLMSTGRIRGTIWSRRLERLASTPIFQCHGRQDPDLSFTAAEQLRHACSAAGALVTWLPFEAGHETPMVAWRGLGRFLEQTLRCRSGFTPTVDPST